MILPSPLILKTALRKGALESSALVFTDHYESSVMGRCWETHGCERDADWYRRGTLIFDSVSTLMHVHHQASICTADTLQSKYSFDCVAALAGLNILGYRAGKYIFNSDDFIDDCNSQDQSLNFCGVSVHHQNGVAERELFRLFRLGLVQ